MASYLQARQNHGQWFLRIDDIDPPREQTGATQQIITSLAAHGFHWDGEIQYQSQQFASFEQALVQLRNTERSFNCICSRSQIAAAQASITKPCSIYPGTCRDKKHTEQVASKHSAVRFHATGNVGFEDLIQGPVEQNLQTEVGDFIVKRRDGLYSYQLANVVDDATSDITEVVRGADLLDNTPRQIALIKALGYRPPHYAHIPIALDPSGSKLSKQTQAPALNENSAIANLAAAWVFLGQSKNEARGSELKNTALSESTSAFWSKAMREWDIRRVPQEMARSQI